MSFRLSSHVRFLLLALMLFSLHSLAAAQKGSSGGGGGTGGGGANTAASPSGGGSASSEAEARMYRAIAFASHDVALQLPTSASADKPVTYIFYDPRAVSDLMAERTFKTLIDRLQPKGPGLLSVSLPGVISTLTSIAGISTSWTTVTNTVSGGAGPTDADAFIATRISKELFTSKFFAPSVYPLQSDQINAREMSPLQELYEFQSSVVRKLAADQKDVLGYYKTFSDNAHVTSALGASQSAAWTSYTSLIGDLKAACTWTPQVIVGATAAPTGGQGSGGNAQAFVLPVGSARSDIQSLRALLDPSNAGAAALDSKLGALETSLSSSTLDSDIQVCQAFYAAAAALATPVAPYGTVSSLNPDAGTPETLGNMIIRGWEIERRLNDGAKLLRVRLEMSQGSDRNTSWQWVFHHDASAMAQLSFMVIGADGAIEKSGSSLAYYGFENSDHTMTGKDPEIIQGFEKAPPPPKGAG